MLISMLNKIQLGNDTAEGVMRRHEKLNYGFGAAIELAPPGPIRALKDINSNAIKKSEKMGEADLIKLKDQTEVLKQRAAMEKKALALYVQMANTQLGIAEERIAFQEEMSDVNQSLINTQRGVVAKMADKAHSNNMGQAPARAKKLVYSRRVL